MLNVIISYWDIEAMVIFMFFHFSGCSDQYILFNMPIYVEYEFTVQK